MEQTSNDESNTRRFRVLMFPWLAHGHMSPFLELSKRLAKNNFQIYFCSTEINLSFIKKDRNLDGYFSDHSIELVQLDLPHFPELPPHYHTTKNLPPHLNPTLHVAFYMGKTNFQNILNILQPDLLIYDMFQAWASELASLFHIPAVLFLGGGAVFWSWSYFYYLINKGNSGIDGTYPFPAIFLRDYESKKMAAWFLEFQKNVPEEVVLSTTKCLEVSSDIVLLKACREIDGKYIDHLSSCCGKKTLAVGPLIELKHDDTKMEEETENSSHIIEFMNGREESSVVYVSFGSEYFLSEEEREEMAYGLELSNANFIWVVRFPVGHAIALEEALPEGFLERVKERGVVVDGWAPQAKILEHPSTGGFVSHCGWSSFMESLYYGVPLLALPMLYDQPLQARLAVEIGVGIEILRDEDGRIKRENVAKVIKEVVVEKIELGESVKQTAKELELGESVKQTAKELCRKLREEDEGQLHEAIEKLKSLCSKNQSQEY